MDTSDHVRQIRENGYTIIESVFCDAEVERIKAALSPWLQGQLKGRNDFEGYHSERVYALLAKDPVLARVVEHPCSLAIIDELLEADYLLYANLAINSHPGETKQNFHRDNVGGDGADPTRLHGISTVWNLDDFTHNNGATEFIPNSHTWTDELPTEDDTRVEKVLMPKGSVFIFCSSLYHRGGANNSDKPRLAITPQYCQPWLRQLETMVLAVPPDKAAQYSDRVQALLGYSVRAPGFMGFVDGVHPKRLIDPDFQGRRARGMRS
ncbi:MAG: phytanoyl-CoA dioxygenase family protein [Gammaproteobacteria bacterium]|nr:phytanoyl-CoA dioxygenase family protein [Gammaproteobacteria bacterium]